MEKRKKGGESEGQEGSSSWGGGRASFELFELCRMICRRVGANVPLKIAKNAQRASKSNCVWLEASSFGVCEPIVGGVIELLID